MLVTVGVFNLIMAVFIELLGRTLNLTFWLPNLVMYGLRFTFPNLFAVAAVAHIIDK